WQTDLVGIQPIYVFIDALDQVEELQEHDNLIQRELGIRLAEWNQFKGMVEAGGTGAGSPFTSWDNYAYTALRSGDRVYVSSADMVNRLAVYDYTSSDWYIYDLDRLYTRGETCELTHQGLQNHLDHMVRISLRYNQTEKNFHIIKRCGNGGMVEGGNDAGGSSFSSFSGSHYFMLNPGNRVFVSSNGAADRISVYNQTAGSWEDISLDPILGTGQLREITDLLQPYVNNLISVRLYERTTAINFHLVKLRDNGGMIAAGTADAGSSFYSFGNSLYTIILDGDNILCSPSGNVNKVEIYDYIDSLSTVYDLDRAYTAYELVDISAFVANHANHYVRIQLREDTTNRTFHMLKRGTSGGMVEGAYNNASSSFGSFSADKYTLLLPCESLLGAFNGHVDRVKVYDFYESSWFEYVLLGGVDAYTVFDFTPYLVDHVGHFVQLQFYDG
ncbi:MAG: hypothetical protein KAR13_08180, partial [Desulfobulbaceae bacterium]|nr:hypothetical protein [Desulfobulbaceae bacterium]